MTSWNQASGRKEGSEVGGGRRVGVRVGLWDGSVGMGVHVSSGRRVTVAELYRYAVQELHLNYIFWGTEEPFYTNA